MALADRGPALLKRRDLLGASMLLLGASLCPPAWASGHEAYANDFWVRPRRLWMTHASGETIDVNYWSDGQLRVEAYREICWFMRDRVTNSAVYIDPVLLDILYAIGGWLSFFGIRKPLILTSGHRNGKRNAHIEGSAKDSLHITGAAADIVIQGVNATQVARFGVWLAAGGVGFYPSKGFTHLDRGRLRVWIG